ncbi:MAG: phosphate ABC transporter permease PstA [Actinomycetota bacterium]
MTLQAASSRRRFRIDRIMRTLLVAGVVIAITPLIWILVDVAKLGFHVINPSFFTKGPPDIASLPGGGILNGIVGTVLMVGLGALIAIPMGLLSAIFIVELSPVNRWTSGLASAVRFFADVMTGIPSIIFGIFVYSLIVLTTHQFSAMAGAVALALIMWPLVLRTSEEMLRLVPNELREAAYALGTPRRRAVFKVVLPAAVGGLVTGILLALARASGETAPLLFTSLNSSFVSWIINRPMAALSTIIYSQAQQPYPAAVDRAWGTALTLIVLVLILSIGARAIVTRRERRAE